jgi:peptidyl-prolyl cis-trans isomerase D
MSIIQSIRDRGAWILFGVIALALVAFILQDGLSRQGSLFGNTNTVAKINGVKIEKAEFDKKVEMASRGNAGQYDNVRQQLFNQEMMQIVLKQEFDAAGLSCGNKQLSEELFKPESPLMNEFRNQETGMYDVEAARQAFANIKKSKKADQQNEIYEYYIKPVILNTLNKKYNAMLTSAAYAPKWLVEKQQAEANKFTNVAYVAVPYSSIADSTIKATDEELVAYATKHSKKYSKDEETRVLQYVTFDAVPSKQDTFTVLNKLETLKQDFANTTDVKQFFAKNSSALPYLGTFVSKKQIQQPVKDSLFKLAVGATYGPYLDNGNYVVAKMVAARSIPDSAKARHILVSTHTRGQQGLERMRDDSSAKHIMDTIQMQLAAGKSFDSLNIKFSDDKVSAAKGGDLGWFASTSMVAEFSKACFTNGVGYKGVVKTEFGYHYIEVTGQKGSDMGYDIAYLARPITVSNETDMAIKNEAASFLQRVKNRKQFDEEVAKLKKVSFPSSEIKVTDGSISGIGSNRLLVKWVYDNNVGDISEEVYNVDNKYVVAVIATINKKGIPSATTLKPLVENFVRNEKKAQQIISTKFKGNTLEAIVAANAGLTIQRADTLMYSQDFVPGLGSNEPKFSGAAFNANNKGKVTEPIAGNSGVFALKVDNIGAKAGAVSSADNFKQSILSGLKGVGNGVFEALKKKASIKDYRAELY